MIKRVMLPALTVVAALVAAGCGSSTGHPAAAQSASPAAAHTSAVSAPNPATASPVGASAASTPRRAPAHHHRHHHGSHSCDASLWQHVYHPDRLQVVQQCKTVRGTVEDVRREPDGDLHIRLATRPALVNSDNVTYEHGDLVLEEICQGPVTQADAIDACQGVPHNLTVPSAGDRVRVTGSYVLDADHGWMEIHPVTRLTVIGHAAPAPAPAPAPVPVVHHHHHHTPPPAPAGCHPTTSSGNCYEPGEFCPTADAGMHGVAGDGEAIVCILESGRYHWHPV
jgi:hypothetical protein